MRGEFFTARITGQTTTRASDSADLQDFELIHVRAGADRRGAGEEEGRQYLATVTRSETRLSPSRWS